MVAQSDIANLLDWLHDSIDEVSDHLKERHSPAMRQFYEGKLLVFRLIVGRLMRRYNITRTFIPSFTASEQNKIKTWLQHKAIAEMRTIKDYTQTEKAKYSPSDYYYGQYEAFKAVYGQLTKW